MKLLPSGGIERKKKREGEERTCGREEEKKEKGERERKREDSDRGKEREKGEKETGCHVSSWGWLREDNAIFN
jgi:hypothetical protein